MDKALSIQSHQEDRDSNPIHEEDQRNIEVDSNNSGVFENSLEREDGKNLNQSEKILLFSFWFFEIEYQVNDYLNQNEIKDERKDMTSQKR